MPRKARLDAPWVLQHVIVRGVERRPIFSCDEDYEFFLKRLGHLLIDVMTVRGIFFRIDPSTKRTTGIPVGELVLWCGMFAPKGRLEWYHGLARGAPYKSIFCEADPYWGDPGCRMAQAFTTSCLKIPFERRKNVEGESASYGGFQIKL